MILTCSQETLMKNIESIAKRDNFKPVDFSEVIFNSERIGMQDEAAIELMNYLECEKGYLSFNWAG